MSGTDWIVYMVFVACLMFVAFTYRYWHYWKERAAIWVIWLLSELPVRRRGGPS
jgi:hypothetical protein